MFGDGLSQFSRVSGTDAVRLRGSVGSFFVGASGSTSAPVNVEPSRREAADRRKGTRDYRIIT